MSNEFGFSFDDGKVDRSVYRNDGETGFPALVWHAKYTKGTDSGFWTLDQEAAPAAPGPSWTATEMQFGGPSGAPVAVWKSTRARVCVLGVRKRQVITDGNGQVHYYPWMTPAKDRVSGAFKSHIQVAVVTPGSDDIYAIALRGFTKSICWTNPPGGQYHRKEFPVGVEAQLNNYVGRASKQLGTQIPRDCTFWIDLVPVFDEKGKQVFVDVGHNVHVAPFTVDFSITDDLEGGTRFVGMPAFLRFQELKRELADWEAAWDSPSEGDVSDGYAAAPAETEEEEIPF